MSYTAWLSTVNMFSNRYEESISLNTDVLYPQAYKGFLNLRFQTLEHRAYHMELPPYVLKKFVNIFSKS